MDEEATGSEHCYQKQICETLSSAVIRIIASSWLTHVF